MRIERILDALDGDDLAWLATPRGGGARLPLSLPGVGRKTAACVLLFSYGLHDVPVDTHVHRVGVRLGLFGEKDPLEAHDELNRLTATTAIRATRSTCCSSATGAAPARPARRAARSARCCACAPRAGGGWPGHERRLVRRLSELALVGIAASGA